MKLTNAEGRVLKAVLLSAGLLVTMAILGAAHAQEVPAVEVVAVPDNIDTWAGLLAFWLPKAVNAVVAIVGTVLLLAMRQGVSMLPIFMREWIDAKRQKDLASAITSKVADLIREGRWPTAADIEAVGGSIADAINPAIVEEVRSYVNKFSPAAAKWAGLDALTARSKELIAARGSRAALELTAGTVVVPATELTPTYDKPPVLR